MRMTPGLTLTSYRVGSFLDSQAVTHFDRVIAAGGTVPAGLIGLNNFVVAAKAARGVSTIDSSSFLSLAHPHYTGIRNAAGTGQTAGDLAASTVFNLIGVAGDFTQSTAANQPLSLIHTGTNYVYLPRVAGNYFSAPYNASIALRDDFDIKAFIQPNLSGATQVIFANANAATSSSKLIFRIESSNVLRLLVSVDGSAFFTYDSTVVLPNVTSAQWVRVTRNRTGGQVIFYTSPDGTTWTQLGTTIASTTFQLFNSTVFYEVGSNSLGTTVNLFQGLINRITVSQTIDGTAALDFNPANYNRATSQSSWTSTTGEVWTNNVVATNSGLKSMIVDTTMITGNGTSYGMRASGLSMNQSAITGYTTFRKYSNLGSGTALINELGTNVAAGSGKYLGYGFVSNNEEFGINGNVGLNSSRFTSTSLDLKLVTTINNIANANESLPLMVNNVSQSFVAQDASNNNTANMNATGYNLLARNNASNLWSNVLLVSDIVCPGEDNTTTRTAMYNFLRTYINGI